MYKQNNTKDAKKSKLGLDPPTHFEISDFKTQSIRPYVAIFSRKFSSFSALKEFKKIRMAIDPSNRYSRYEVERAKTFMMISN